MSGLGEAASIASFVSLGIQIFDGCIKGFVLLSAALDFGSRAEFLSCQLDWEHYRLSQWARSVGLLDDCPHLNVPNPELVNRTLGNLHQLLTNAKHLRENYDLDIRPSDGEIQRVNASTRTFGRLLGQSKPRFLNDTARVFSRRTSAWKKLKWVAFDVDRFKLLLEDVGRLNQYLESILHPADQHAFSRENDAVIRYVVAHGPDRPTLDALQGGLQTVDPAVGASAKLRNVGVQLDLIQITTHSTSSTLYPGLSPAVGTSLVRKASPSNQGSLRLDSSLLSQHRGHSSLDITREVAVFQGSPVILEWKDLVLSEDAKLKYRVAAVAKLLAAMNSPSFHSLCCFGFIKVPGINRYAYVFSPPLDSDTMTMKTLLDLLTTSDVQVSMNQRLRIALALAQTVLQLHTAGWLHKSIRPDNVLFFKGSRDAWAADSSVSSAFLGGYETARADNPLETTEAPSSQAQHELYRHPRTLGAIRASFTKRFDLYSLGCVLIELAFWKPLQSILFQYHDHRTPRNEITTAHAPSSNDKASNADYYVLLSSKAALFEASGRGSLMEGLQYHMGDTYSKLVKDCLTAAEWAVDDELDESVEIQENIVTVLSDILQVI